MKRIAILGSTGSIGTSTLAVIRHLKSQFKITALAAHQNIDLLEEQAREFNPLLIAVYDINKAIELQRRLPHIKVLSGMEGICEVAAFSDIDTVISAMTGARGLVPTVKAIEAGKDIGLANKEALVAGGSLIMRLVKKYGVNLIPIDSEHSAIFQCLKGEREESIHRIILTTSGGPFRNFKQEQLNEVTIEQALNHPNWKMGPKITIDSSTLMNKGLEVIEAYWLFGVNLDQIEVVVQPQSLIHSLVEYKDGSIIAQMSEPNMMGPIQFALTYPERCPANFEYFDFTKHTVLEFFKPNLDLFRCLGLAYEAIRQGGSLPCYMNAANEVLVQKFLSKEISWREIANQLERLMNQHKVQPIDSLESILEIDAQAREEAADYVITRY